jgi:diguanylate cyclase (GGDEF)-like protein/PAS domain S-box-containing protein
MGVQMESELKYESPFETYKLLFDFNDDACYALDVNGNFKLFNHAAVELTGYTEEEALKMSMFTLFTDDYFEKSLKGFQKLIQGKQERIFTCITHKNGTKVDLDVTSIPIFHQGQVYGIVGIARDITEKNKQETFLSSQNQVLEMIATGSPFFYVLDKINNLVEELSKGVICSILLTNQDKTGLIIGSAPSLPPEYRNSFNEIAIGTSLERELNIKDSSISDSCNASWWIHYRDMPMMHGMKACWSAPVFDNQEKLLAVFVSYFDENRAPTKAEKLIVEKAVYLTSLTIQHYYAEEKINYMAFHDDLTGLPNRRLFDERVNIAIKLYKKETKRMFGLMYFDLDRFKQINESLGQNIGDLLLKEVANRLKDCMGGNNCVYRWGGDEFVLFLDDISKKEVERVAKELIDVLAKPFFIKSHEIYITPGIGISLYPPDGDNLDELLRKADSAMFQAKKQGRNTYQFFNPSLDLLTREKLDLENQLRKALVKKEFNLHYQPIIDLSTNKLSAVEALIRWNHTKRGNIPPDQFIPIAEETGMILTIGEWVLRTACTQMKEWLEAGLQVPTISVNISIRQFYQPNLVTIISQILAETGLNPSCLTIEITESMTMDVEAATDVLYELKKLGVNISIDDFGTGYSSFSYLRKFPIDHLKIDKTFIRDIAKSKEDENIATSILLMAQKLGLKVIAEGVETNEQLGVLRENQCNKAQGFLFSKPVSSDDLKVLLTNLPS